LSRVGDVAEGDGDDTDEGAIAVGAVDVAESGSGATDSGAVGAAAGGTPICVCDTGVGVVLAMNDDDGGGGRRCGLAAGVVATCLGVEGIRRGELC